MELFPFPYWQMWEGIIIGGVLVVIASVVLSLLARTWMVGVTYVVDMLSGAIRDILGPRILGLGLLAALVIGAIILIPKAVSQSGTTLASLWPTATPTPLPRWEFYFPIAAK